MTVRVDWIGRAPPDAEEWEELLRAEHGRAKGTIEFWIESVGPGWEITRVRQDPAPPDTCRADVRQRFVAALRMGGKAVIGESGD
jgi:hypothetical protein